MHPTWTFLTNHGFVLLAIARRPDVRLREIADEVGITLRAAQAIVNDLVDAGYVERGRAGRRNRYVVHPELPLRHALTRARDAGDLIRAVLGGSPAGRRVARPAGVAS